MPFQNNPSMHDESGETRVKRYVHQPLTIEHYGLHAKIQENGRVVISSGATVAGEDVEISSVEIPASLVFKLATLLKATRTIKYVSMSEVNKLEDHED